MTANLLKILNVKSKKPKIKKIIKGNNSTINDGTYDKDRTNGIVNDRFKFLKNSISSNKFNIMPKERKIKTALTIILKKFIIKYL